MSNYMELNKRMQKKLREGMKLQEIKSVAWYVIGEDYFKPKKVNVRFEDQEGRTFDLLIHPPTPIYRKYREEEEVILNVILSLHHIMPKGKWIGFTNDLEEIINMCRKSLKYTGVFFINENDFLYENGWSEPEHVF